MGPDCGTAYINGVPLAFANAVNKGTTGVIAASGTGLQEFSVLLHRAGGGIKHGIGVGGRDLTDSIGGISTLTSIDLLANDDDVDQIVLISKPPGDTTAKAIFDKLSNCGKPVITCVFGFSANQIPDSFACAITLKEAADLAIQQTAKQQATATNLTPATPQDLATLASKLTINPGRQSLIGLYTGGTLCTEALLILSGAGLKCTSNTTREGFDDSVLHRLIDLGADEYTVGRPHPMIEPAVRTPLLQEAIENDRSAIILLDLVLGYGAHDNPAADVVAALNSDSQKSNIDDLPLIVASVCGTDKDPQNYQQQRALLEQAGVIVCNSNSEAAELCTLLLEQ